MAYERSFVEVARAPTGALPLDQPPSRSGHASDRRCRGDAVVDLAMTDDVIRDAAHHVRGCVMASVSASLLAERVTGLHAEEARALARGVADAIAGRGPLPDGFTPLRTVLVLPSHRACALLPWTALLDALA